MGWTSKKYKETTHLNFKWENMLNFLREEYLIYGYEFAMLHLHKAKDKYEHNEIYAVIKNDRNETFIAVIIVDIKDEEIYWKYINETMGPAYHNCPKEFFNFVKDPGDYATEWRIECLKRNIKHNFKNKIEFYALS